MKLLNQIFLWYVYLRLKRTIEKYDNRGPISIEEHEEQHNNYLLMQKENEDLKQVLNWFKIIINSNLILQTVGIVVVNKYFFNEYQTVAR